MEGECNVVDITLSDNEDHYECLSLKERLLFLETQKEKHTMPISACPLKKRLHSGSDDAELDSSDKMNEMKPKINECSHDEQPDLVDLLKECYGMNFRDNDKELKKSSSTIPTNAKKPKVKQDMDLKKELAKQEKIKLKEEKMKEKNLMKALKASEKEIQKSKRPDECLKGMKIYIDQSIIYEKESEDIFCVLDESNLRYNIEENSVNMSVIWCRQVVDATVENNEVIKKVLEQMENTSVILIQCENFIKMAYASMQKSKGKPCTDITLLDYVSNVNSILGMEITLVVVGFDKYQRSVKESVMCNPELKKMYRQVSKTVAEEVATEVQFKGFCHFSFLNNMREFGEMLARFSKALAEAPERREKHAQKCQAFSWYADADSSCPVKIGKDGSGFLKLWQQQIQQFNNVGPEVAEAITSEYPSPQSLIKAYKECSSLKKAETLLQDIVVRRNYGPLGTQRRIGPELSYKIYLFYTSKDGDQILQR